MLTSSRTVAYGLLAAVLVAGMALVYLTGDDAEESAYPTPGVIAKYKAGIIPTGGCRAFGPDCIPFEELTRRQQARCFTFRDDTFDRFCSRVRVPRFVPLPEVNDYLLEGVNDPDLHTRPRECVDVRTSCYYPITIQGVHENPCAEVRKAFERMLDEIYSVNHGPPPTTDVPTLQYPGCSNHGSVARFNSSLRDPEIRQDLAERFLDPEFDLTLPQ